MPPNAFRLNHLTDNNIDADRVSTRPVHPQRGKKNGTGEIFLVCLLIHEGYLKVSTEIGSTLFLFESIPVESRCVERAALSGSSQAARLPSSLLVSVSHHTKWDLLGAK